MGKKKEHKKKKGASEPEDPKGPFESPFAALGGLRDALPPGEELQPEPTEGIERESSRRSPSRAVVRYQRKGRGGKEVTLVEQLDLTETKLREWLKALKQDLGCGGVIEEATLVLQGDQRERLPELLQKRGVRKVSES